jgi:hypothetical protein
MQLRPPLKDWNFCPLLKALLEILAQAKFSLFTLDIILVMSVVWEFWQEMPGTRGLMNELDTFCEGKSKGKCWWI